MNESVSHDDGYNDRLTDAELEISIRAAFLIGQYINAATLRAEVGAAEAALAHARDSDAPPEEITRLDHALRYWKQVSIETDAVFSASHQ